MKLTKTMAAAATLALSLSSGLAFATDPPACSPSAITVSGAGSVSCLGYFDGNLNGNAATWTQVNTYLSSWGVDLTGAVSTSNMVSGLGGATSFSFGQTLYGDSIIGIHYGNIKVGTGKNATTYNDLTAFYRFDAGTTGITTIGNNIASISNATLYSTGVPTTVPEPETYAMMLAGIGMLGMIGRRRKQR